MHWYFVDPHSGNCYKITIKIKQTHPSPVLSTLPPGHNGRMRRLCFLFSLVLSFFLNYALFAWMKWYTPSPRPFVFALVNRHLGSARRLHLTIGSDYAPYGSSRKTAPAYPGKELRPASSSSRLQPARRGAMRSDDSAASPIRFDATTAPVHDRAQRSADEAGIVKRPVTRKNQYATTEVPRPTTPMPILEGIAIPSVPASASNDRRVRERRIDDNFVAPPIPDTLRGGLVLPQPEAAATIIAAPDSAILVRSDVEDRRQLHDSERASLAAGSLAERGESGWGKRLKRPVGSGANNAPPVHMSYYESSREAAVKPDQSVFSSGARFGNRGGAEPLRGIGSFYPQAGVGGGVVTRSVTVSARITIHGVCVGARIVRSSGFPVIDQTILKAVRQAAYRPAMVGGVPVESEETFAVPVHRR